MRWIDDNRSRRRPAGRQGAVPAPARRYNQTMDRKSDSARRQLLRDIRIAMAQIKAGKFISNREAKAELRRRLRRR